MNLPNLITFSRLLGVPFLLYGLYDPSAQSRWICTAIFVVAAATDWLDGYLARKLNQITDLGKFLDPLVDKLLVIAPLLVLIELGGFLIIFPDSSSVDIQLRDPTDLEFYLHKMSSKNR